MGTEKDGDHVMALPAGRAAVWGEFPTFQLFQALGERRRRLPVLGALLTKTERNLPISPPPNLELERKEGRKFVPDGHTGSIHSDFSLF